MTIQDATRTQLTVADVLALGESHDIDLIDGVAWEYEMTLRNSDHTRCEANLSYILKRWLEGSGKGFGVVLAGEAGFQLGGDPDTLVGIDVALISTELARRVPRGARIIEGVPVLAVEIVSPSDPYTRINLRVRTYLSSGTRMVWIVDPAAQTVEVQVAGRQPLELELAGELDGGDILPGLRVPVREIFE